MNSEKILCPSANCQEGAILIGIVMRDGRVAYSAGQIIVNQEFVETARAGRAPEKRFRFGGLCVKSGCRQWSNDRCGVIDSLVEPENDSPAVLPECSIRPQCRWFNQSGASACAVCPDVVTDLRLESD